MLCSKSLQVSYVWRDFYALELESHTVAYQKRRISTCYYILKKLKSFQRTTILLILILQIILIDVIYPLNARLHNVVGHCCAFLENFFSKAQQPPILALDNERKGQKGQACSCPFTPPQEGGELNGAIFFPKGNYTTSVRCAD